MVDICVYTDNCVIRVWLHSVAVWCVQSSTVHTYTMKFLLFSIVLLCCVYSWFHAVCVYVICERHIIEYYSTSNAQLPTPYTWTLLVCHCRVFSA